MKAHLMDLSLYKDFLKRERALAPTTERAYVIMVNAFLGKNPDIDNHEDYNNHIVEKAFKSRSYYAYYALRSFIEFKFKENKKLKNEIIENLRKPSMPLNIKRERRNLEPEQILDIIVKIKKQKHQIVALIQKMTGLRAGDVLRIKKGNILVEKYDGKEILRIAAIGKRGKRVVVEIFDDIAQKVILHYINNNLTEHHHQDYYFLEYPTSRKGCCREFVRLYLRNYNVYLADLKQALNASGIMQEEFASHDFRRNFARSVWMKYKNLLILQKILGHNDPKTTMRYLNMEGLDLIEIHREMQADNNIK